MAAGNTCSRTDVQRAIDKMFCRRKQGRTPGPIDWAQAQSDSDIYIQSIHPVIRVRFIPNFVNFETDK